MLVGHVHCHQYQSNQQKTATTTVLYGRASVHRPTCATCVGTKLYTAAENARTTQQPSMQHQSPPSQFPIIAHSLTSRSHHHPSHRQLRSMVVKPHRLIVSHGALAVSSCCCICCGMALLLPPTQQQAPVDCSMTIPEQGKQRRKHIQAAPVPGRSMLQLLSVQIAPSGLRLCLRSLLTVRCVLRGTDGSE